MAGEDLVAELGVEEAETLLELLDSGGGGAGGEGGGGELRGVEVRREKGGQDWVGGESVQGGRGGGVWGCSSGGVRSGNGGRDGGVFEGGGALERRSGDGRRSHGWWCDLPLGSLWALRFSVGSSIKECTLRSSTCTLVS